MKCENTTELRVALANYDLREIRVQKNFLQEQDPRIRAQGFQRGEELLRALQDGLRFDVIVLGSQLEDMDEHQFLQSLRQLECRPLLLLFDEGRRRMDPAGGLNLDSGKLMHTSLQNLMQELSKLPGYNRSGLDTRLNRMWAEWGLQQEEVNCGYFASAVRIACGSEQKLAIRKEILQAVSEQNHVSVAAVDSGIRRMVEELETAGTPGWDRFKRKYGFGEGKPTTGKLIYAAKQYLLSEGP